MKSCCGLTRGVLGLPVCDITCLQCKHKRGEGCLVSSVCGTPQGTEVPIIAPFAIGHVEHEEPPLVLRHLNHIAMVRRHDHPMHRFHGHATTAFILDLDIV